MKTFDRRHLMQGVAAAGAAALLPRGASAQPGDNTPLTPLEVPPWTLKQGAPTGVPYGSPSPFESHVRRILPARPLSPPAVGGSTRGYTPLQDLHGIITPNGLFFERHHAGVPEIDPEQHRLVIHGLVEREMVFTMADLLRMPAVSRLHFLECSGNSSREFNGPAGLTVQQTHGLLSCCQWTGVPLSTLLAEVGLKPDASWILAESADGSAMTRSLPVSLALKDCLIVYAQNGERLRPEQGYPLRLLVPGGEGNMNIKWLRRLEVGDQPFETFKETRYYTDLLAPAKDEEKRQLARQFTFIMEARSVITSPSGGQQITENGFLEIRGLAWSGRGRIQRVDVSVDGGSNWCPATLDVPVLPKCLTSFRLPWHWEKGEAAVILSRAIDESGYVQPTRAELLVARGIASNYHFNGIQAWSVDCHGEVRNVKNNAEN
jgi:sulfane dehydrogenase subunit SoxC